MGRLEKQQAGAVTAGIMGAILLLAAVVLTLLEQGGALGLIIGVIGGLMIVISVTTNARVAREMINEGRR